MKTSGKPRTLAPLLAASLTRAQTLSTPPCKSFHAGSACTAAILTCFEVVSDMIGTTLAASGLLTRMPELSESDADEDLDITQVNCVKIDYSTACRNDFCQLLCIAFTFQERSAGTQ